MISARGMNQWYRQALGAPHNAYSRVEVWRSGTMQEELVYRDPKDNPTRKQAVWFTGSVRATLASRVARTLTLNVPEYMYPYTSADLLWPFGAHLKCFRGIRYGDGSADEFPIFNGAVASVKPQGGGTATVQANDLAYEVISAGFSGPTASIAGSPILLEFTRLVEQGYPAAVFGISSDLGGAKVPVLTYDQDRGAAIDALAKAVGSFWYPLADGSFVMRRIPWTVPVNMQPIELGSGNNPDLPYAGSVYTAFPLRSNAGVVNRLTYSSERADGGAPIFVTLDDNDTTSPTWIGGPFGVKAATVRVTSVDNSATLLSAAKTAFARARALTESWELTCTPDASIELGDALKIRWRGVNALQLVASYTIPLEANGTMQIQGRDLVDAGVDTDVS